MPANGEQPEYDLSFVAAQFEKVPKIEGSDRAVCKHCGDNKAYNMTQYCKKHLWKCAKFKAWKIQEEKKGLILGKKRPVESIYDFFKATDATNDELFALAVYTSTANFSMFETPEWNNFFSRLKYTPPIRQQLSESLLDKTYLKVKEQVLETACNASYIQIVSDGSANIAKQRVENVSFIVDGLSYYWNSTEIGAQKAGADWSLANIKKCAKEICLNNLKKFTAFSSDTDSTQRSIWSLISQDPELKHVHSIPCNSHGVALMLKDILWPGKDDQKHQITTSIGQFFKDGPNTLVSYFRNSPKQLAFLRNCMLGCYTKVKSLIATVPTRWGTQAAQIDSILNSSLALRQYAHLPDAADEWKSILRNIEWWQQLTALQTIIQPIHEKIKMSESNKTSLNKIYPQWIELNSYILKYAEPGTNHWWEDIYRYVNRVGTGGWEDRMKKQLLPVHLAAYMLTPENREMELTPGFMEKLEEYILMTIGIKGYEQWTQYHRMTGEFNPHRVCWTQFKGKPKLFWISSVSSSNS